MVVWLICLAPFLVGCTNRGVERTVPTQQNDVSYFPIETAVDLARMSSAVVVGVFERVESDVWVEPTDAEDQSGPVTEYDGWVFRPVEWVKGGGDDEIVMVLPSAVRDAESGETMSRFSLDSYPAFDVGQRFVLFLARVGETGFWVPTAGPLGVAEITVAGTLRLSSGTDLSGDRPLEEYQGHDVAELIDAVRDSER